MYRIIILILQKFLWSKLLKGRLKSKLFSLALIVGGLVFIGAFTVSYFKGMTYIQSVGWIWGYIEVYFIKMFRVLI